MAIGVLILGESGSGKSYSMRNLSEDEVKVISIEKPILPFKNHLELTRTNDVNEIIKEMKATKKKIIVIDDFQYILGLAAMRRSLEKGWDKFSEMQFDYFKVLDALKELPDDVIVYFMSHIETTDDGVTKIKTIGKALDKYITIEGMFMIVLGTKVADGNYYFITQTNGKDTLKSPAGMFPSYAVDNDLKYIDEKIRNYYEIGEFLTDEEMAEIDEAAKKDDIPIADDGKKRRGRRSAKKEESEKAPVKEEKEENTKPNTDTNKEQAADAAGESTKRRSRKSRKNGVDNDTGGSEKSDARQVHEENIENESFQAENGQTDSGAMEVPAEPPKRRTRKSREEVEKGNAEKVAYANVDETGEKEEIPFEEAEEPKLDKPPRRTRKNREKPAAEAEAEAEQTAEEERVGESTRTSVTGAGDKTMTVPTTAQDHAHEETPAPRRRRRRG